MTLKISDEAKVQMPMKTVASLIALVAIGTWAFFSIHETLNRHTTTLELMEKDLEQNSEFRIKYPRGELEYKQAVMTNNQQGWKAEFVLILVSAPVMLLIWSIFSDDPEIMEQHKKLFEVLGNNQPTTGYNY